MPRRPTAYPPPPVGRRLESRRLSFSFNNAGEHPYFCLVNPHMTGKVIVK